MANMIKDLNYKLSEYPHVKHSMLEHAVFAEFLDKATDEQLNMLNDMLDEKVQIVFVNAKSGTGKTQMAVLAAYALSLRENKELLYIMSPVEEDKLGFTKGTIQDKERKYMTPLFDALEAMGQIPEYSVKDENLIEEQKDKEVWCETKTHTYVRGTNIKNKTLIIEEAQNFTTNDLQKVLSRVHDSTKVFVIGHEGQIDLKNPNKSGFVRYIDHFKNYPHARMHELTKNFRGMLSLYSDEIVYELK